MEVRLEGWKLSEHVVVQISDRSKNPMNVSQGAVNSQNLVLSM